MVVDQILDVVEEAAEARQRSTRKGLLGSAVIGNRVTDFIDLQYVMNATKYWLQDGGESVKGKRILVAEASAFSRGLIRNELDMAGYRVLEAGNLDEAIRGLEQQSVDVVVAALDLSLNGGSDLLAAMRQRPEWARIPVLALANSGEQTQSAAFRTAGFQDCQRKFDQEAMLQSVSRLASHLAPCEPTPAWAGEGK
jgi:CheY-like chemotaxis protein